jgi:hypothetical protein
MAMKSSIRIPLFALAAAATVFLFSCAEKPVSITDRIGEFFTSLNGDRSDTYTNLDPSTAAYTLAKPASFWKIAFDDAKIPYSYSNLDTSTPADVTLTIDNKLVTMGVYHFVMVNIGTAMDNWVIDDIQAPPGGSGNTIFH